MNVSDLRVGITLYDSVREQKIILELKHFKELAIAEENFFERYKPILLDEQWLIELGFVNGDYDEALFNPTDDYADQFKYILKSGVYHRDFVCFPAKGWIVNLGDYKSEIEIKYVHEMQNVLNSFSRK